MFIIVYTYSIFVGCNYNVLDLIIPESIPKNVHWNRDCPADFFGATGSHGTDCWKKHLNGSRKGRWKHIFSADDGRGSSMKIPLHSWTSVRSCDWCMTHCCVLCAEWPRKRQVSGPWTHGTGVWKMVETKGFLERRWTRPPHPCTSLIFCRSVSLDHLQIAQTLSLFSVCALSHLACPRKISIAVWSNASAKAVGIQALSWTLRHHGDSKWEGRWLAAINWIQPLV